MDLDSNEQQVSSSTSNEGASGAQSTDNASEGGDIDFREFLSSHKQEMEEVRGQIKQKDSEIQNLKTTTKTLEKLRDVFSEDDEGGGRSKGGKGSKGDPFSSGIEDANANMDKIIEMAMQAERDGRPIPLTANLGVQLQKFRIEQYQQVKVLVEQVQDMKSELARLRDPGNQSDTQAYNNLEGLLESAIDNIYGPNDDMAKGAMMTAVSNRIIKEIRDLKQNDPTTWMRIRRDQQAQRKMVAHFVKQQIPPRARQIMEQDEIRRTPMSFNEKMNAFREAKELLRQQPKNEQLRAHFEELREEIVAERFGPKGPARR